MITKSGYDFYLDKCLLPVAPGKLQIKINNANRTITMIDQGEINLLKVPGLSEVEFECEIPQVEYPFAVYKSGFQGAAYFLGWFERLKTGCSPFQFIVSRRMQDGTGLFGTNMKVSMEDYQIAEDADDGFDLKVKIRLKQFREYGTRVIKIKNIQETQTVSEGVMTAFAGQSRAVQSAPTPSVNSTHTFREGETLWGLAKRYYGDGSRYTDIYEANRDRIRGGPLDVEPGLALTIPEG